MSLCCVFVLILLFIVPLFLLGFDFSHLGHDATLSNCILINRDCFVLIGFMEEEVNIQVLCIITHVHCVNKKGITLSLYFKALMFIFYQHSGFVILDTKIKDKYKIVCNIYFTSTCHQTQYNKCRI